jgi:hypothetical protein
VTEYQFEILWDNVWRGIDRTAFETPEDAETHARMLYLSHSRKIRWKPVAESEWKEYSEND